MGKPNYEITTKITEHACYKCSGVGHFLTNKKLHGNSTSFDIVPCDICNGTGIYIDKHYFLISGGFSIDMDTIK